MSYQANLQSMKNSCKSEINYEDLQVQMTLLISLERHAPQKPWGLDSSRSHRTLHFLPVEWQGTCGTPKWKSSSHSLVPPKCRSTCNPCSRRLAGKRSSRGVSMMHCVQEAHSVELVPSKTQELPNHWLKSSSWVLQGKTTTPPHLQFANRTLHLAPTCTVGLRDAVDLVLLERRATDTRWRTWLWFSL